MRHFLIVPLLLMCFSVCRADVTATIKDFKLDDRRLIWAVVEYDIDGQKVINPYPMQKSNIVGLSQEQFEAWLGINIIYQCDTYIGVKFKEKNKDKIGYISDADYYVNDYHGKEYRGGLIKDTTEEDLIKEVLIPMIGKTYTRDTAPLITGTVDAQGKTIIIDKIEIKTDGTYVQKNS